LFCFLFSVHLKLIHPIGRAETSHLLSYLRDKLGLRHGNKVRQLAVPGQRRESSLDVAPGFFGAAERTSQQNRAWQSSLLSRASQQGTD